MYRVLIIIPYFGKFPNYFNLWLKSVEFNNTINWLLITDNNFDGWGVPENLRILNLTFEELKNKIQRCFDFGISLERPYKLCDYKPAYGCIFSEEIKGYDFWGFGDVDLIYGNLKSFITEELLHNYDRIFACGHLSLIRNNEYCNSLFKSVCEHCFYYKDVYSGDKNFSFDEFGQGSYGGFYQICQLKGLKLFNKKLYADILVKYNRLVCDFGGDKETCNKEHKKKHVRFLFVKGKLFQLWKNKNKERKEVTYIHLQKRKMKNAVKYLDEFFIYPHVFAGKEIKFRRGISEFGLQSTYIKQLLKNCIKRIKNILHKTVR